jgi:serine/threonine protein kinase
MWRLSPLARRVLELRLQGEELDAIARLVGRSDRTVRRQLQLARELLDDAKGDLGVLGGDRPSRRAKSGGRPTRRGYRGEAGRKVTQPADAPRAAGRDLLAPLAFGDYLLQQQIGAGAVGKVYRAAEKNTSRAVAVKFLRKSFVRDERIIARFRAEAETVARLSHPGIVAVRGLGRTPDGGYFIVMDLVNGVDLARRIAHGPVSPRDAGRWIGDAAVALDYSHRQGVVHCDLKPSNLLLAGGRVLVTDFGFARDLQRTDVIPDYVAGTPAYMAPEQIDAAWGPITPRTDVYGLGAVLFHLVTGRPPFVGDRLADVLSQTVSGGPAPSPARFRPDLPAPLVETCVRCLAKTPADRFRTTAEVADVLQNTEWRRMRTRPDGVSIVARDPCSAW